MTRALLAFVGLSASYACAAGRPPESPSVAVEIPLASAAPGDSSEVLAARGPRTPPPASAEVRGPFRIEEIAPGYGAVARTGDTVEIAYAIAFVNGNPIDTTLGHSTVRFQIGVREVIPGLAIALNDVRRGTRRRVTLPANVAENLARGLPTIPEGSAILIDFEIVAVYPAGTLPPTP